MSLPFNVDDYEVTRAPVVDTFKYSAGDPDTGTQIVVDLSPEFLAKTRDKMNARSETGDLCPIVIGHTKTGAKEVDQPPKVGYLHNYQVEPYNGTPCLFADHYIRKQIKLALNGVEQTLTAKEIVERFPRRSGEIWFGTYEIDPHSLLGATTPHRSLGLLKLSADGKAGYSYSSPGELTVADAPKPENKTGEFAEVVALLKQAVSMIGQLQETITQAMQPMDAHGADGGGGGSLDDLMRELEGGEGEGKPRGDEKPKSDEKPKPEPKEDEEKVKLQKERDEAVVKLARNTITSRLSAVNYHPDESLILDLIAQPEDVRERFLVRLERPATRVLPSKDATGGLSAAIGEATTQNENRITTAEQHQKVLKLARSEGLLFEQAAKKLGFKLPGQD